MVGALLELGSGKGPIAKHCLNKRQTKRQIRCIIVENWRIYQDIVISISNRASI